jgi:hypothetical protein
MRVLEGRGPKRGVEAACLAVDLVGVLFEADLFAADQDLHGLMEAVQEPRERRDERRLLFRGTKLEARALRRQKAAEALVGELDEARLEDARDWEVERCKACSRRAPREWGGEPVGGEDALFG